MLNDDTTDLIERLADVQQEKWLLEEKVHNYNFKDSDRVRSMSLLTRHVE